MSTSLRLSLPRFDRNLLRTVARVVPSAEREEWSRTWQAELWHVHHRSRNAGMPALAVLTDLSIGLIIDALWLRTESWKRTFSGTATLCLAFLFGLSLFSTLIALALTGSWHALSPYLRDQFNRSFTAAPLILFVACATASRRHIGQSSAGRKFIWLRRQLFFVSKTVHVLLVAFLLSADVCLPIHASLPNTADLLQMFCFVLLALIGLRWALRDQEQRCTMCLHSLTMPARVGRPSHNLLEWNGTELNCKRGHGLLSVPEMETSWCESSHWVECKTAWNKAASM